MQNCDGLLGLSSVGLEKGMQTLSRVLVLNGLLRFSFKSRRMAGLAQRELFTSSLGINCARFRLQPTVVFPVQQARAQLCNPSGGDCVMSPD